MEHDLSNQLTSRTDTVSEDGVDIELRLEHFPKPQWADRAQAIILGGETSLENDRT